jgi:chemotaxis protein MotA
MDITTLVGLIAALGTVIVVMILDGGSPLELFSAPAAILLIFSGSLSATIVTVSMKTLMLLPKFTAKAFANKAFDAAGTIDLLAKLADKARRDGLLGLEEDSKKIEDKFLQKGIMMIVDGVDPDQVASIMETSIEQMRARHKAGINFFASAGGFAPTFGILGTVMGLINVLKKLDDPGALGPAIASAFLATLWGLLSANLIFLPISGKLKAKDEEEARDRTMMLEGILSIQAGENPRIVRDKLTAYLPPSEVKGEGQDAKGAEKKPAGKAEKAKA